MGGVLLFAGLLGLPAWVVQFAVSAAGGGDGGGPLSPWQMCGLLAVAIAAGLALLQIANLGLGSGSTAGGDDLDRLEVAAMDTHGPVGAATGRFAAPADVTEATVALAPARVRTGLAGMARHELRLRAMSRQIAAHKRRRRDAH